MGSVADTLGRPLRDLRISVTDRCNFRCVYCMPREVFGRDFQFLARERAAHLRGDRRGWRASSSRTACEKVRLTGGEPLLRRDLERLVRDARRDPRARPDADDERRRCSPRRRRRCRDAGLQRVTVSLDSLDDAVFRAMNDVDFPVARVLEGIDAAAAAGLPGQDQRGRAARRQRGERAADGARASGSAATSCASSSTWTWATRTAGGSTTSSPRPRSWRWSTPRCRSSRPRPTTTARSPAGTATATAAARSA